MSLGLSLRGDVTSPVRPYLLAVLAELLLTSIHHGYGAVIYAAPFRYQVVVISAVVAAIVFGLAWAAENHRGTIGGKIASWLNTLIVIAYPILAIGLIEGGYNHVVKNIVYLLGNRAAYASMFPAGAYEIPTNWFFEVTGLAQFPLAMTAVWLGIAAWRRAGR